MNFARKSLTVMTGRIGSAVFAVLLSLLLAWWLEPIDYGHVSVVLVVAWGFAVFLDMGITPAHTYLLAKDARDRKSALLFSLSYCFVAGLICSAFVVLDPLASLMDRVLNELPYPLTLYAMCGAPLLLLLSMHGGSLLGMNKMVGFAVCDFLRWGIIFVFMVIAVFIANPTSDAASKTWLFGLAVTAAIVTFYFRSLSDFSVTVRTNYFFDSVTYGFRAYLAAVGFFVMRRIDYLFLTHFHTAESVATYNLSTQWMEILMFLPGAVGLVLFPQAVTLDRQEAHLRAAKASRMVLLYAIAATPILAALFWVVLWTLNLLGRGHYQASWLPFLILLPGGVALAIDTVLSQHLAGRRLQHLNSYVVVFMVILNLILNTLTIPKYGVWGAAASTTVSFFGGAVLTLFIFLGISRLRLRDAVVCRKGDLRDLWDSVWGQGPYN